MRADRLDFLRVQVKKLSFLVFLGNVVRLWLHLNREENSVKE